MTDTPSLITRREAVLRVTALLGGMALVGGTSLLTGCRDRAPGEVAAKPFSTSDIALLEEIADTILPTTTTPGAKAVQTGAFMAMMVTDTYSPEDRKIFRDGLRALDDQSRTMNGKSFMESTPQQRLALLERLDRDQKAISDQREDIWRKKSLAWLSDQRKEAAPGADVGAATAVTDQEPPAHYFRMMKELALLGYFTSEIGMTQALRYAETPGRFDPCAPYTPGEKAWAPHA
jgi:hypothetical protein